MYPLSLFKFIINEYFPSFNLIEINKFMLHSMHLWISSKYITNSFTAQIIKKWLFFNKIYIFVKYNSLYDGEILHHNRGINYKLQFL